MRDSVAAMARQYVRTVVGSVQRVAMAIAPSQLGPQIGPKSLPGSPEALTLAQWIARSYRYDFFSKLFAFSMKCIVWIYIFENYITELSIFVPHFHARANETIESCIRNPTP